MNARTALDRSSGPIANDVAFNHDNKYFSVATNTGFSIYTTDACETYLEQDLKGSIGTACMLGASQIVGLSHGGHVPLVSPNKLMLWDSTKKEQIAAITTRAVIIRTCLTDTHMAIVMENAVSLYTHQGSIDKVASYETTANELGLCCLGRQTLCFPGRTPGQIQILSLQNKKINIIPAHTSSLRALALSPDEEVIASGSANGTLVRVHSTQSCSRLAELRRGVGGAAIYSIAISPSGENLALTSDTSTLHIFDIPSPSKVGQAQRAGSPSTTSGASGDHSTGLFGNVQKWGGLAKLPFAPRVFTDVYSFASTKFDPGKEEEETLDMASFGQKIPTLPKTRKGVLGWLDDETLVVLNAGKDARYERFILTTNREGRVVCARAGWFRFLRPN